MANKGMRNVFSLVNVTRHGGSDDTPLIHNTFRAVLRPESGPCTSKSRIVLSLREHELGSSYEDFCEFAAGKLKEQGYANSVFSELPTDLQFDLPAAWTEPNPYIYDINNRTRRDAREERATRNESQGAPGTEPSPNHQTSPDANSSRRSWQGFSQEQPTMTAIESARSYMDAAYKSKDAQAIAAAHRCLDAAYAACGSFKDGGATADFSSADSGEYIRQRIAEAERSGGEGRVRDAYGGDSLPAERREFLLNESSLGRRVQRTRATDKRYRKRRDEEKALYNADKIKNKLIREGGETSMELYDCPTGCK